MSNARNDQAELLVKLVFIGDSGVGKTSLLNRECSDQFHTEHLATIGVDFKMKYYDFGLLRVKGQIWDTAGQERFRSIQKPYYKNAKAVCICFSLADRKSFENLPAWLDELVKFDVSKSNTILVGCKSDLDVMVATDEILVFASQNNLQYYQTSSKLGEGVHEAFNSIMLKCAQQSLKINPQVVPQKKEQNLALKESYIAKIQKKACC